MKVRVRKEFSWAEELLALGGSYYESIDFRKVGSLPGLTSKDDAFRFNSFAPNACALDNKKQNENVHQRPKTPQ